MSIRGQITRLPFSTGNTDLPILINYDFSDILADILSWPTLRAFFDFSDLSTMTTDGDEVVTVADLTGTFLATADSGERGTYGTTAMNDQPGLILTGAQRYNVPGLMGDERQVSWASCFQSEATDTTSRMVMADADTLTQTLYVGGDNIRMFSGATELAVPSLRNRPVNTIWTMDYSTDEINTYADGLTVAGTSNSAVMSGAVNIGAWYDSVTTNRFIGALGYCAVFVEDASQDAALRNLLDEYALRRWRMQ